MRELTLPPTVLAAHKRSDGIFQRQGGKRKKKRLEAEVCEKKEYVTLRNRISVLLPLRFDSQHG